MIDRLKSLIFFLIDHPIMKAIFCIPCLLMFTLISAPGNTGEPKDEINSALIEACQARGV